MTDNTPRPTTPAPSEGDADATLAKELEDLDEISIGRFQDGRWLWATLSEENFDRIVAALRRPSYTQGAEAMRGALTSALLSLAHSNISPDVQELLVHGNPQRKVAPHALEKALTAALPFPPAPKETP